MKLFATSNLSSVLAKKLQFVNIDVFHTSRFIRFIDYASDNALQIITFE